MIDGDTGEIGHRFNESVATGLHRQGFSFRRIHTPVLDEFLHPLQLDLAVDAVDLRLVEARCVHIGVARDGDRGGRLSVVGNANQDDGVGVGHDIVAGVQLGQFVFGERVAVGVGPAVHADEHDVQRAVFAAAGSQDAGGEAEDAAFEGPDRTPGDAGADHDHDRQDGEDRAAQGPGTCHCRHFCLTWHQPRLLAIRALTR